LGSFFRPSSRCVRTELFDKIKKKEESFSMTSIAVVRLTAIVFLAAWPAVTVAEPCLEDYLHNERWVPHAMTREDLKKAVAAAQRNGVDHGWKFVSRFGDNYAGLASLVTRDDSGGPQPGFGQMVHRHWQTVVGPELERAYFDKVAAQHFKQYVRILETGTWPDSNQILLSYLTAVRSYGLPDELVFDAAWLSSRYRFVSDWRAFNTLPFERWANTDRVCLQIDETKADQLIERDFGFRKWRR